MFKNMLKWTFKVLIDGIEKELPIHLDADTSIQAIEQMAMQMIAHCSKVKEFQASQASQAVASAPASEEAPVADPAPAESA